MKILDIEAYQVVAVYPDGSESIIAPVIVGRNAHGCVANSNLLAMGDWRAEARPIKLPDTRKTAKRKPRRGRRLKVVA